MTLFIIWLLGTAIVTFIGKQLGHGALKPFIVSLILSPAIGLIVVLLSSAPSKKCPKCAETVKPEALKCKHCGHEFLVDLDALKVKEIEEKTSRLKVL